LALLKSPSKQPKTTTLQVRLEEEVRRTLDKYAEFLDANPSYVVSEALSSCSARMKSSGAGQANTVATTAKNKSKEKLLQRDCVTNMKSRPTQFGVRENTASSRQHAPRRAVDSHLKFMGVEEQIPRRARSHTQTTLQG